MPGEYGGASNTYQIAATGFPPPVYAETGKLPRGVTLNAATGLISGTPPATGTYALKIRAASSAGASVQRTLTIHVGAAPVLACKAGRCDFTFYAAVKVDLDLRIGGDPATHFTAVEPLPHGLRVTQGGLIYGTPTRVQLRKPERLDIFNAIGGDDLPGSMRVLASHPAKFNSRSRWSVRRGHRASFTISATGPPAPAIRWSGKLPRGLKAHARGNGRTRDRRHRFPHCQARHLQGQGDGLERRRPPSYPGAHHHSPLARLAGRRVGALATSSSPGQARGCRRRKVLP